ncbi:hypothetical protein ASE67_01940 [Sphingomonas sp. Leaf23]|uniref:hypothetical protein n=1 Tax=Sphingomonas sp. Leaf23 TaxID=1735689 RepID=UPI0006FC5A0E|nr:hypothetical protein [Sphingomonas sp. Leaf23]KQM88534.1 hypothetical protein ASE67_01940 [Sphingomonas sp. Leaf23]
MKSIHLPTFDQLRRQLGGTLILHADRLLEMRRIIDYLSELGFHVSTSSDIFDAIKNLEGEEELAAFHCVDGVAISNASDGWWLLISAGDLNALIGDVGQNGSRTR